MIFKPEKSKRISQTITVSLRPRHTNVEMEETSPMVFRKNTTADMATPRSETAPPSLQERSFSLPPTPIWNSDEVSRWTKE